MRISETWSVFDTVASTQDEARKQIQLSDPPGIIFGKHQTSGRGRLGRSWSSQESESLTMSVIVTLESNHERPWLLGMATALVVADVLDCRVQWPNDLTMNDHKVGGILTELFSTPSGRPVPVIGIGLNLNQTDFPVDIDGRATSVFLTTKVRMDPWDTAQRIVAGLRDFPLPTDWSDIKETWAKRDSTPGKTFKTWDGRTATAQFVGEDGSLWAKVDGTEVNLFAAEALFGGDPYRL